MHTYDGYAGSGSGYLPLVYDQCLSHWFGNAGYDEVAAGVAGAAYASVSASFPYGDARQGGTQACWGPDFLGHHGSDTAIYTADVVLGGNIRVFIGSDLRDNLGEQVLGQTGIDIRDPCGDGSISSDDEFMTSEPCGMTLMIPNCPSNGFSYPDLDTLANHASLDGMVWAFYGISTGNLSAPTTGTSWTEANIAQPGHGGQETQGTSDLLIADDPAHPPHPLCVPLAADAAITKPAEIGGPTQFVVGFFGIPPGVAQMFEPNEPGIQPQWNYNGGTVIFTDTVLHFAVVQTYNPAEFTLLTLEDPNVKYCEMDPKLHAIGFTPNDPSYPAAGQYGMRQINADDAWDVTLGSTAKSVCVVDTGVRYTHQDLTGGRYLGGYDFANSDNDPMDDHGHGTHVAGIAAATTNNGLGVAGVGAVGIRAVKVFDANGYGTPSQAASGIRWCADHGGDVISMSFGWASHSSTLESAVQYAWSKGKLLVAAAGNQGCAGCILYPAKYPQVIPVTCTTSAELTCGFSNTGPEAELAAPGESVLSTWASSNTAYATLSGTSMSTPHASGSAALVWSFVPGLTNQKLRSILRCTAQDHASPGRDPAYGFGIVNTRAALDAAVAGGCNPGITETLRYSEGWEGGLGAWTVGGYWHRDDSCGAAHAGTFQLAWNKVPSCTYSTGSRAAHTATSPPIDLAGTTQATLSFAHRYQIEYYPKAAYDILKVQVSLDGGAWKTVGQWDSRDPSQANWVTPSFDIDVATGGLLRIRLVADTMNGSNNNFPGWFLDNVQVTAG